MISVLDIPKGNFSFFSNKVLTDTDVAVYFKPGSSPKISVVLFVGGEDEETTIEIVTNAGLTSPSDLSIL